MISGLPELMTWLGIAAMALAGIMYLAEKLQGIITERSGEPLP